MKKQHLIQHLRGFANSLENNWMDERAVYEAMFIILSSAGLFKIEKEIYLIKDVREQS